VQDRKIKRRLVVLFVMSAMVRSVRDVLVDNYRFEDDGLIAGNVPCRGIDSTAEFINLFRW